MSFTTSIESILASFPAQFIELDDMKYKSERDLRLLIRTLGMSEEELVYSGTAVHPSMPVSLEELVQSEKFTGVPINSEMHLSPLDVKELMQSTTVDASLALTESSIRELIVRSQVYISRDGLGNPLPKTPVPVVQVSTAGLNFAYGQNCNVHTLGLDIPISSDSRKLSGLSESQIEHLWTKKWSNILDNFVDAQVTVPILSAIGLGSFLPRNPQRAMAVRRATTKALTSVLQQPQYQDKFERVIVSIPPFAKENIAAFTRHLQDGGFRGYDILQKNMFDMAFQLAKRGIKAGILNASDKEALVSGNLGQYWYSGHVALEETFVYHTTLLLNNWAVTKQVPIGWIQTLSNLLGSSNSDPRSPPWK
jgi:hypothetical protein